MASTRFSVRSLYLKLCQGSPLKHFGAIWKIIVPLEIRVFLCQLVRKQLHSSDNIFGATSQVIDYVLYADLL
jgi:hypothetical protein